MSDSIAGHKDAAEEGDILDCLLIRRGKEGKRAVAEVILFVPWETAEEGTNIKFNYLAESLGSLPCRYNDFLVLIF